MDNIREDGHTLLLIEAGPDERTFSDYRNLKKCLETIVNMYEEYRSQCCLRSEGDLKEFQAWLDGFHRIEVLVLDSEISRYKQMSRAQLKQKFEEKDEPVKTRDLIGRKSPSQHSSSSGENWDD